MKAGAMNTGALKKTSSVPLPSHDRSHDRKAGHASSGMRGCGSVVGAMRPLSAANGSGVDRVGERHDADSFSGNAEPAMMDVLNEPIIHTIMRHDGVDMDSLQHLIHEAGTDLLRRRDEAEDAERDI